MQKSLLKNSVFNIIYTVSNILFPFITSIYVSRILLPAGVGKVAGAQNLVSYFVTLAALGLPSYGVREFAKVRENKEKKDTLFTELFLINMISTTMALIAFVVLLVCNDGFNNEWSLYISCGLTIFFNYLNIDWIYQGLEEYGYITGRSIAIKIISLLLLFILVRTKNDYVVYALLTSLALGGNYIFNIIYSRKIVHFSFRNLNIKKHVKPVAYIAGIIFMSTIYNKVDVTMLNMFSTDEAIGFYSYGQKTVNIVLTMCSAVTATFLPRLSFYFENDRKGFYRLFDKGFQILCFAVVPLAVGLFLLADQAVILLYGKNFASAGFTIRLMCPLIIIKGFGDLLCYQLAYSSKNEKILLPASALASIINVTINAILIPLYAQNGAVIASVLSEFVTNTIQLLYLKKKVKYLFNKKSMILALISTIVMVVAIQVFMQLKLPLVFLLGLEVIGGVSCYFIINVMAQNRILFDLLDKMKNKLKK